MAKTANDFFDKWRNGGTNIESGSQQSGGSPSTIEELTDKWRNGGAANRQRMMAEAADYRIFMKSGRGLVDDYNKYVGGEEWQDSQVGDALNRRRDVATNNIAYWRDWYHNNRSAMTEEEYAAGIYELDWLERGLTAMPEGINAATEMYGNYNAENYGAARQQWQNVAKYSSMTDEEIDAEIERLTNDKSMYTEREISDKESRQREYDLRWNAANLGAKADEAERLYLADPTNTDMRDEAQRLRNEAAEARRLYSEYLQNPNAVYEVASGSELEWINNAKNRYAANYYRDSQKYGVDPANMKSYELMDYEADSEEAQQWVDQYILDTAAQEGYIGREDWERVAVAEQAYDNLPTKLAPQLEELAEEYYLVVNTTDTNTAATASRVFEEHLQEAATNAAVSVEVMRGYVESVYPYIAKRQANAARVETEKWASDHPFAATVGTYFTQPLSSVQANMYLTAGALGGDVSSSDPMLQAYTRDTAIRGRVGEDLASKYGDGAQWLYNAVNSTVDSTVNMLITRGVLGAATPMLSTMSDRGIRAATWALQNGVSNLVMGSGASAQRFIELKQNGVDDLQALAGGMAAGFFEGLTEAIGGDRLAQALLSGERGFAKVLQQGLAEGLEELASNELNGLVSWLAYDEDAAPILRQLIGRISGYEAAGYDSKEAMWLAFDETFRENASAFFAGMFSGMLHLGAGNVAQSAMQTAVRTAGDYAYTRSLKRNAGELAAFNLVAERNNFSKVKASDNTWRVMRNVRRVADVANYNDTREATKQVGLMVREAMEQDGIKANDNVVAAITKRTVASVIESRRELNAEEKRLLSLTDAQRDLLKDNDVQAIIKSLETVAEQAEGETAPKRSRADEMRAVAMMHASGYEKALNNAASEATVAGVKDAYDQGRRGDKAAFEKMLKSEEYAAANKTTLSKAYEAGEASNITATVEDGEIDVEGATAAGLAVIRQQYNALRDDDLKAEYHAAVAGAYFTGKYYGETRYAADQMEELYKEHSDIKAELQAVYEQAVAERKEDSTEKAKPTKLRAGETRNITEEEAAKHHVHTVDTSKLTASQRQEATVIRSLAKRMGFSVIFFDSRDGKVEGWHQGGTIYLDVRAGYVNDRSMLRTMGHELTHFIQHYNKAAYNALHDFIIDNYYESRADFESNVSELMAAQGIDEGTAVDELVARGCEMMLKDSKAPQMLYERNADLYDAVSSRIRKWAEAIRKAVGVLMKNVKPHSAEAKRLAGMTQFADKLQELWDTGLVGAVENLQAQKSPTGEGEAAQYSIREIVGESGKAYGVGVYLDSTLLSGLTEAERIDMVRLVLDEVGGDSFLAYDDDGNPVKITIADKNRKFRNKRGKLVPINRDLNFYIAKGIKQEAIVHVDEVIHTASYGGTEPANHPHDWLDNNGTNDWDVWTTYLQDKENAVWKAKLRVANTTNGEKVLYEIFPIEMAEGPRQMGTTTANTILPQSMPEVKQNSLRDEADMVESLSDRELLAQVLLSAAQTEDEIARLTEYQQAIADYDAKEVRLREVSAQIKELSFKKGPRDTAALDALKKESAKLKRELNSFDKTLLTLETTATLKALAERQRQVAIAKTKAKGRETLRAYREKRNESDAVKKYRKRIETTANTMLDWLTKNNDKKHVPEDLKGPLVEFLEALDMSSDRSRAGGDQTKKELAYIRKFNRMRNAIESGRITVDGGTLDLGDAVKDAFEIMGEVPIYEMSATQLRLVDKAMTSIKTAVTKANQTFQNKRYAETVVMAEESIRDYDELAKAADKNPILKSLNSWFMWQNSTPYYAFRRLGPVGESLFEEIQEGWGKLAKHSRRIEKFANETYGEEDVKSWGQQIIELKTESGQTVKMSATQAMSLYALSKRAAAQNHLLQGGIKLFDVVRRVNKWGKTETVTHNEVYHLTINDLAAVARSLNERQVEVADKLQQFMTQVGATWGNEVSMARFGYKAFGERNYFPMTSDPDVLIGVDISGKQNGSDLYRVLNLSPTKGLTEGANNTLAIGDIFEIFSGHMTDMAKYNALALPVLDMIKWYNYKGTTTVKTPDGKEAKRYDRSVQRSLKSAFGKHTVSKKTETGVVHEETSTAAAYVKQFIQDLNGASNTGIAPDYISRFMGRYKKASVAANLRVAIQQPTSIARAAAVISPKHLKAGAKNIRQGIEEMLQYSGEAIWKDMGFFDTNIGTPLTDKLMYKHSKMDWIDDKTMKLAERGDQIVWGIIWNACKAELSGKGYTDAALLQKTAERFRQVIYSTQVMDATTTRSGWMRSNNFLARTGTAFMSEPTLSVNIAADAVYQYVRDIHKGGDTAKARAEAYKKHKGQIVRAFAALTINKILTAVAASLVDAMRDDDDFETFWEKYIDALGNNMLDAINLLNDIPFVGDMFQGVFSNYSSGGMDTAFITQANRVLGIAKDLWNVHVNGMNPTEATYYGKMGEFGMIYEGLKLVSNLTGLPLGSISRDVAALWNFFVGGMYPDLKLKTYNETPTEGYEKLYFAIVEGDEEAERKLLDLFVELGYADDAVRDGLKAQIKDHYLSGELSEDETKDILISEGYYSATGTGRDSVNYQLDQWSFSVEGASFSMSYELKEALATGDVALIKEAAKQQMARYGQDESAISEAISEYFKPLYINGTHEERNRIRALMMATGYFDAKSLDKKLNGWLNPK